MAKRTPRVTRRAPMGTDAHVRPKLERGKTTAPETPLALRARGVEVDDELREYIAKRAGFKLGKFAPRIERTSIRLEDIAGAKGAPAKRCAITVSVSRHESVVVEIVDYDHRAAFDHAIDSVERAVRRSLERSKAQMRRR